jgi:diguanylate cyclase (GGDEF)-like protein
VRKTLPPMPAVALPRSRSLRSILWFGLALCLAVGVGSFSVVVHRVVGLTSDRSDMRGRFVHAIEAHDRRMLAIMEQDAAVRSEAPDPPALERARQDELEAAVALAASLADTEEELIEEEEDQLDAAIAAWRAEPDARKLAVIRERHATLREKLWTRMEENLAFYRSEIDETVLAGGALIVLGIVFATTMVVWILRRTATPLEKLSRIAAAGHAFPPPDLQGVKEVDTLAWALHELDGAVRDREEKLAAAHAEAVGLSKFGEHVQQIVDETELHDALAGRLREVSGAQFVNTLVRNGASERLEVAHHDRQVDRLHLPILAEPMRCRALRTLKPVQDVGGQPTACRCAFAPEGRSYLCKPMLAAGEIVGVVNLQAKEGQYFPPVASSNVRKTLSFGATALASLRLLATTRERALRDALTGAYNRAFLGEFLDKHLALASRRGEQVGVLAIDLDHFKRLNDTFGHAMGDRALVATVQAIQQEVRSSDAVVRWGGEELIVVLVETDAHAAGDVAERIRNAIADLRLFSDDRRVPVRASIGVAAFPEHGHDQGSLLEAADRALYRAKAGGRNQIALAAMDESREMPAAVAAN